MLISRGPRSAAHARVGAMHAAVNSIRRSFSTEIGAIPATSLSSRHTVVVIGGGTAGLAASHQLLRSGCFRQDDIAIVDPSKWHDYQPGWTLVGGGLKNKENLRSSLPALIDRRLKFYNESAAAFNPKNNAVTLSSGARLEYDHLVVAPGISIQYDRIKGLPEALADPHSSVSTIYGYDFCDKVTQTLNKLRDGNAIFTQPSGILKCAGAPQKVLWMAVDKWKRQGLFNSSNPSASPIKASFATGLPAMFGVAKYSEKLEELRIERGVEGLFQHDLCEISGDTAIFLLPNGEKVVRRFDLLHVVPKMGPHAFVSKSPLADENGQVDVHQKTTQHKTFPNVWSIGDASSLPTSKTAAAITAQAPVMVSNILQALGGKEANATYDGYTSCPLITEYGKVMLAEFAYGGKPKETFGKMFGIDQSIPRRSFYFAKKDFFPWVYYNAMVKGTWAGPRGFIR